MARAATIGLMTLRFAPVLEWRLWCNLRGHGALTGCPAGLLINFNVPVLKDGLTRVLNTKK